MRAYIIVRSPIMRLSEKLPTHGEHSGLEQGSYVRVCCLRCSAKSAFSLSGDLVWVLVPHCRKVMFVWMCANVHLYAALAQISTRKSSIVFVFSYKRASLYIVCGFVIVPAECCVWYVVCVLSSSQTTGCQHRATNPEKVLSLLSFVILLCWYYEVI